MTIIAADDEKLALDLLVETIKNVVPEAKVTGFTTPQDALAYTEENDCDVAFLDIKMRGISGLELAKKLKDINGNINIVFVTGYSDYAIDAFRLCASDYLLKPASAEDVKRAISNLRNPVIPAAKHKIRFRCFGNFEVFYNDKPLTFKREKAKELLAYLVDRTGAEVTTGELMTAIWEDGEDSASRQSYLRNLVSDLRKTLSAVGAENIIIKTHNHMAIDCTAADCDYFDFLRHVPYAVNSYHGEYMSQYSWAELTTASLSAK